MREEDSCSTIRGGIPELQFVSSRFPTVKMKIQYIMIQILLATQSSITIMNSHYIDLLIATDYNNSAKCNYAKTF